jgi:hypothetical protein
MPKPGAIDLRLAEAKSHWAKGHYELPWLTAHFCEDRK